MLGVINLGIVVDDTVSRAELCLNKQDILALFNEVYAGLCVTCGSPNNSKGVLCCVCFPEESRCHADCCLAEEEDECPI